MRLGLPDLDRSRGAVLDLALAGMTRGTNVPQQVVSARPQHSNVAVCTLEEAERMPQRTNRFQRLVALLHAALGGQARVTESIMLRDKVTGQLREVDILIQTRAANYETSIGIEVVSSSRPAGTPWVEKMRAKHANLPVNKLVLVSENGFAAPAIEKARFYNIETLTVEEALCVDWPLALQLGSSGVFELTLLSYTCKFLVRSEDGTLEQIDAPLDALLSAGGATVSVDAIVRTILCRRELRDVLHKQLDAAGGSGFWMSCCEPSGLGGVAHKNGQVTIVELRIGLNVRRTKTPVSFATGKFQSVPFVFGTAENDETPLDFILVRNNECTVTGRLSTGGNKRLLTLNLEPTGGDNEPLKRSAPTLATDASHTGQQG